MNRTDELKQNQVLSPRMEKLTALAQQAVKLRGGILKERVAVPSQNGGYTMVVREVKV